ncbi:FAD/NAD(P)-binding protein [Falsirhodobacter sp. 20TX0035]|uniref:FAD/NAD(P)-binding protein n=1 Tax=Falsirhodobacter sp. 20TX0035 TaxID=3022019 RepID=UPI00232DD0BD|nr:FAD/NAD(P)-binding protein [Falsirhodobacter sp. 20TX0035]MDB6454247.1 FAD/NAD(P)-binding protein [Falsirhodobacter sp. 20TX0035]
MSGHIAIVGTGPTGIYTFQRLIEHPDPLTISLFESGPQAGIGMPYSSAACRKSMLANIASIEIPDLPQSYLKWMTTLPKAVLRGFGVDPDTLDDRQFTPRLLLGQYFRAQFIELLRDAEARGHVVHIHEETEIVDILPGDDGVRVADVAAERQEVFDRLILATGHVWPEEEETGRSYYPSPWTGLFDTDIPPVRIGVMGTSLSSIDAAMAVAAQHGTFAREADGHLIFRLADESRDLKITLMSRTGILPEADFYCPIPYEPLRVMTDAALEAASEAGEDGLLDRVFALFVAEIEAEDPVWAEASGLASATADSIADAYFSDRLKRDPFRWAASNLAEVERNKTDRRVVRWRYAILRMHEKMEALLANFSTVDRERFDAGLKRVFIDNYAAVPSESIRRLLALRDAGVLNLSALGRDYDRETNEFGTTIVANGTTHVFDIFIDARGQRAMTSKDLPFPKLRDMLLDAGCDLPVIADDYSLIAPGVGPGRIAMGAIPYLMHDRPFVQGITAAAEIGRAIGAVEVKTRYRRRATVWMAA